VAPDLHLLVREVAFLVLDEVLEGVLLLLEFGELFETLAALQVVGVELSLLVNEFLAERLDFEADPRIDLLKEVVNLVLAAFDQFLVEGVGLDLDHVFVDDAWLGTQSLDQCVLFGDLLFESVDGVLGVAHVDLLRV